MPHAKTQTERFLETADVARAEGIVPATVRADVAAGRLKVSGLTRRGGRLFRPEDVAAYHRLRVARAKAKGREFLRGKYGAPGTVDSSRDPDNDAQ